MMKSLRFEIERVVSSGRFTTEEARRLLRFDWRSLSQELPTPVRQEADVVFHLIQGAVEEVDEGYVDDEDHPEMRKRLEALLSLLPKN
jgi:hypothetical protein